MTWWRFSRRPEVSPEPKAHASEMPISPWKQIPSPAASRVGTSTTAKTAGEPIHENERVQLESAFSQDFSDVRIHRDAEAAELSHQMEANAFTVGRHIYFARGAYSNLRLAHELAHVVQQSNAASAGAVEDPLLEQKAREAAGTAVSGGIPDISAAYAAPLMQRDAAPASRHFKLLPSYSLVVDNFDIDKFDLSDPQKSKLQDLAKRAKSTLHSAPDTFITIVGFADHPGTKEHNLDLGDKRGKEVMSYLTELGIPADAMRAMSRGDDLQIVPSFGYEAKNRRVEVDVTARSFFTPPILTPPTPLTPPAPLPPVPRPDLTYHPPMPTPEEEAEENIRRSEEMWKQAQQILAHEKTKPGTSVADLLGRVGRELAKKLGLPKWAQDRAESLAQDLPAKGAEAVFDQLAGDKGLSSQEKNAVHAVIDALSKSKIK
jgi:outer membrane protein OmpA-like peptidoglycan-associated protein